MCFSAGVSFGAAAVLGGAGVISLKKVSQRGQVMFASLPLLFGIQQACEGVLWLSLTHSCLVKMQTPFTFIFLFFAQVLWTTFIPLSFLLMEKNPLRKKLLYASLAAGICDSLLLGYRLVFYEVRAEIDCRHIYYNIGTTQFIVVTSSILYVIAIILPPFISSVKETKILGTLLTLSLLASKLIYESYLISVWCFFAAVISIMVVHMMKQFQKEKVPDGLIKSSNRFSQQH
ncbi:MAG: DUF6629 family protein [Bacteroidota bacterium]